MSCSSCSKSSYSYASTSYSTPSYSHSYSSTPHSYSYPSYRTYTQTYGATQPSYVQQYVGVPYASSYGHMGYSTSYPIVPHSSSYGSGSYTIAYRTSFPEVSGKRAEEARAYILSRNPRLNVVIVSDNGFASQDYQDYQDNRIIIYAGQNGIVTRVPIVG
jgi:Potato inhibitor I family.